MLVMKIDDGVILRDDTNVRHARDLSGAGLEVKWQLSRESRRK